MKRKIVIREREEEVTLNEAIDKGYWIIACKNKEWCSIEKKYLDLDSPLYFMLVNDCRWVEIGVAFECDFNCNSRLIRDGEGEMFCFDTFAELCEWYLEKSGII